MSPGGTVVLRDKEPRSDWYHCISLWIKDVATRTIYYIGRMIYSQKSTNSLSINDEGEKRSNEGDRERIIYHFVQNTQKKSLLKTYLHMMMMMDATTTTRSITTHSSI